MYDSGHNVETVFVLCKWLTAYEARHVISNNVAFLQVKTQASLCSLLLSLETPNDVQSVA